MTVPRGRRVGATERRNLVVDRAVTRALARVEHFMAGGTLDPPSAAHIEACDAMLARARGGGSAKAAALMLMFYWLEEPQWDRDRLPTGIRGKYGDKRLSEQLNQRHVTMHDRVVAFAENVGWKGDVSNVRLLTDLRLGRFLTALADADPAERERIADYLAHRFAQSRQIVEALPPVGPNVLTFVRAKQLFYDLVAVPSGGSIPQFLVTALLAEHRQRFGVEVRTHNPHAADAYDRTAGDVEEFRDGEIIRAYEVTMRPDWKDRISGVKDKMDRYRLPKYVVIAANINEDEEWSMPARAALALEPYGRDIAVVDIRDVLNFFAAELTAAELVAAVNRAFRFLTDLSGRPEYLAGFRAVVLHWLDEARPAAEL